MLHHIDTHQSQLGSWVTFICEYDASALPQFYYFILLFGQCEVVRCPTLIAFTNLQFKIRITLIAFTNWNRSCHPDSVVLKSLLVFLIFWLKT